MTAIDHKAVAEMLLNDVSLLNDSVRQAQWVAEAQVHATLALVAATEKVAEQARIGNLIAIHADSISSDLLPPNQWNAVAYEIRDGLGLS